MQADEATYHGEAEAVALFRARAARRGATEAIADLARFDSGCADPGLAHGECNALAFALRLDGDEFAARRELDRAREQVKENLLAGLPIGEKSGTFRDT